MEIKGYNSEKEKKEKRRKTWMKKIELRCFYPYKQCFPPQIF